MTTLLHIDFPFKGPFGSKLTQQQESLAQEINKEKGLIWKVWTENPKQQEAGGVYLFKSEPYAQQYLQKYLGKMISNGITEVRTQIFEVNTGLSLLTRGPI